MYIVNLFKCHKNIISHINLSDMHHMDYHTTHGPLLSLNWMGRSDRVDHWDQVFSTRTHYRHQLWHWCWGCSSHEVVSCQRELTRGTDTDGTYVHLVISQRRSVNLQPPSDLIGHGQLSTRGITNARNTTPVSSDQLSFNQTPGLLVLTTRHLSSQPDQHLGYDANICKFNGEQFLKSSSGQLIHYDRKA